MVEELEYQDRLVVKRIARNADGSTKTAENGKVLYDIVHESKCDYQITPVQTKIGGEMYVSEPTVFFPLTETFIQQDDIVEIITHFGRGVSGFVRNYDKVDFGVLKQSIIYLRIVQDEA